MFKYKEEFALIGHNIQSLSAGMVGGPMEIVFEHLRIMFLTEIFIDPSDVLKVCK